MYRPFTMPISPPFFVVEGCTVAFNHTLPAQRRLISEIQAVRGTINRSVLAEAGYALSECIDRDFTKNISYEEDDTGAYTFYSYKPVYITYDGLVFLESLS